MTTEPHVFDITMELKDEYTALVNRQIGKQLQHILTEKVHATSEGGVLLLDFTVVTSIHQSFLAEFLIPVLQQLMAGLLGNRSILGIGADQRHLSLQSLDDLLQASGQMFVLYDKSGGIHLLGATDGKERTAFDLVRQTRNETADQLALQMLTSPTCARALLDKLAEHRVVLKGRNAERQVDFFDPVLPPSVENGILHRPIGAEIRQRIEKTDAVEDGVHYVLPSGRHVGRLLHLSRVLADARFTRRIGVAIGEQFSDIELDAVLAIRTANNLVLAHAVADYLDVSVVSAVHDTTIGRFVAVPENGIKPQMCVLVIVDVIATGWTVKMLTELAECSEASVEGVAIVVDTSGRRPAFGGIRTVALTEYAIDLFSPEACPLCKQRVPSLRAPIVPRI